MFMVADMDHMQFAGASSTMYPINIGLLFLLPFWVFSDERKFALDCHDAKIGGRLATLLSQEQAVVF